jgi:RNA polymerase sigma factor (TIGR02999 family)
MLNEPKSTTSKAHATDFSEIEIPQNERNYADDCSTELMQAMNDIDPVIAPAVYKKLQRVARNFMYGERIGHTMQPTDLVHEACMRLFTQSSIEVKSESHLISLASTMMRRILITHAVARKSQKRGGGLVHATLGAAEEVPNKEQETELISIDRALDELERRDPRQAKIVELRYFAGLSIEETALALEISITTVKREWSVAKLWLKRHLTLNADLP